jgi:putative FmdB family regulatory protein
MPIYEFRCPTCGDVFEILLRAGEMQDGVRCTQCGAAGGERVLSRTSYSVSEGTSGSGASVQTTTRSCSTGSCGTITLPGHAK